MDDDIALIEGSAAHATKLLTDALAATLRATVGRGIISPEQANILWEVFLDTAEGLALGTSTAN